MSSTEDEPTIEQMREIVRQQKWTWNDFNKHRIREVDGIKFWAAGGQFLGQHFIALIGNGQFVVMDRDIINSTDNTRGTNLNPKSIHSGYHLSVSRPQRIIKDDSDGHA